MEPTLIFWIIACIAFILIEAITQQLVAVWFVIGSACSLLVSLFDVSFDHQIIIFIIVSILTLIALRPLLKKFMSGKFVATNTESNIGQLALVTKEFDPLTLEGRILVNNMDWAAKSIDGHCFKTGEKVIVQSIEGVKCLVTMA